MDTKKLQEKRDRYVARGVSNGNLSIADQARGATVIDGNGYELIDFGGAIGTLNVGHSHPKVVEAVKNQAERYLHPGFNCVMYDGYIEVAEKLCGMTPGTFEKKAILFNSGAEAVENAVKMARKYTNKTAVVSFKRGYHGRTNLTMGMTSKVKPYKNGFGPFASDIYQAPFPYLYRKHPSLTDEEYIDQTIQDFKDFFIETVTPENVACIVMEPVQGEGGFIIPPKRFVEEIVEFCKENNIVFVADEIQTGFGRTGKLFASEHFGIEPDLVTVSKSLAAGLPLSGVVGRADILDASEPGELGGTFAGNPVACAAALAVFDIIESEKLCIKAEKIGEKLERKLSEYQSQYNFVGEIRRLGAMVAVEVIHNDVLKTPDKVKTGAIAKYANDNGLILLTAGIKGNVIRFLLPLVTTDDEFNKGIAILDDAFKSVEG